MIWLAVVPGGRMSPWLQHKSVEAQIRQHQAVRLVEHRQALLHIAHGHVELFCAPARVLLAAVAFMRQSQLGLGTHHCRVGCNQAFLRAQVTPNQQHGTGKHQFEQDDRADKDVDFPAPCAKGSTLSCH